MYVYRKNEHLFYKSDSACGRVTLKKLNECITLQLRPFVIFYNSSSTYCSSVIIINYHIN